jgi:hypothetical protein
MRAARAGRAYAFFDAMQTGRIVPYLHRLGNAIHISVFTPMVIVRTPNHPNPMAVTLSYSRVRGFEAGIGPARNSLVKDPQSVATSSAVRVIK